MYSNKPYRNHVLSLQQERSAQEVGWSLEQVAGRLVEISGVGATAPLTLAFGLVLQAQRQNEPVAWITRDNSLFYPPDAAEGGIDLDALVIIRVPDGRAAARAADQLARSGAFGLVVLDLGAKPDLPAPLQIRLAGLANKHQTALLCLTVKGDEAPSLGPLVSLRVTTRRERLADGRPRDQLCLYPAWRRQRDRWDYRRTDHSPRGHPLASLREALKTQGFPDARTVASIRHGSRVRYAGLIICRQRPGTAGGVTFMTLEDETGFVNIVLWPKVFARYATLAKAATLLGVTGTLQAEQGVVHLVADRLWQPSLPADLTTTPSRDFH